MKNIVEFSVRGRYALFTDPITKMGGEKCTYHLPTFEALKGVAKSVYWKPTFLWVIDRVRVMRRLRTEAKSMKPIDFGGGNSLAIYTYLSDVEYQVRAHIEWNPHREDLAHDRIDAKHWETAKRCVEKGGRRDVFLGTRECQAYVEPCIFGEGEGYYDDSEELAFGLMFHGFDYPDETGVNELHARFYTPVMRNGVIEYPRPEACTVRRRIREMTPRPPRLGDRREEART
jgi:CRISPR-associated protein Cas5d